MVDFKKEGGGHSAVLLWLRMQHWKNLPPIINKKPLSNIRLHCKSSRGKSRSDTKALWCARREGSFTVEAAFVLPLFLFAAVVVLGLFPVLLLQVQVNGALQYAARIVAVSFQDDGEEGNVLTLAQGRLLFCSYMKEHGYEESVLKKGLNSISLLQSDFSGDEVLLCASYEAQLPISFWTVDALPVEQSVCVKKWTGAATADADSDADTVYITPTGSAYHASAECSYLKLSVRSVSLAAAKGMRNKNGGIYYPCSCYGGGGTVYVTDYGTQYHGSLSCSGLKRTIYAVPKDQVGNRHACAKCY